MTEKGRRDVNILRSIWNGLGFGKRRTSASGGIETSGTEKGTEYLMRGFDRVEKRMKTEKRAA